MANFYLSKKFINKYRDKQPNFGPLGYVTYRRTYARPIENENRTEEWWETCKRVVEGTYQIQKEHCRKLKLPWNSKKAQKSAQEMFNLMWDFKFLPPGRGLWMMGTDFIKKNGGAALNNPLGEDTKILTKEYGWTPIKEIEDQIVTVLTNTHLFTRNKNTPFNSKWVTASISKAEMHPAYKITYKNRFGNKTTIISSQNHRWFRRKTKKYNWERVSTEELKLGDFLPTTKPTLYFSKIESYNIDYLEIINIERLEGEYRVLCATVPFYEQFVIEGFCLTSNCSFVSTRELSRDFSDPFAFLMDMSMLGVGVGSDTKGAKTVKITKPNISTSTFVVQDSREGWIELLKVYLDAYSNNGILPKEIDYSQIRAHGSPIKGFGGTSSGPLPLKQLIEKDIPSILDPLAENEDMITGDAIVDIFNAIGKCVVSGNVRRCLPGYSRVYTKEGYKKISEIKINDYVSTPEGFSPVTNVFKQGIQDLIRVNHQDGYLDCTPNHVVAILTEIDNFVWKEASKLKKGDRLFFPRNVSIGQEKKLPSWNYIEPEYPITFTNIKIPTLDSDMSWFIGIFCADGYTYTNYENKGFNAYVSLVFNEHEYNIAKKAQVQLSRFGTNVTIEYKKSENSWIVHTQSMKLAWYFAENIKLGNKIVAIPIWIKENIEEIRLAFVAGVADSNSYSENRPIQVISTVYKEFALDIKALLGTCGIESRFKEDNESQQKKYFVNLITLSSQMKFSEIKELNKELRQNKNSQFCNGFPASWEKLPLRHKWGGIKQINVDRFEKLTGKLVDWLPIEVESIVSINKQETYDIEVSSNHSFVVDGVTVHNSAEIMLGQPDDQSFLDLKNPEINLEKLNSWRWASNNSVFATIGMDYNKVAGLTAKNGEPGYIWLDTARKYGRLSDPPNNKDILAQGTNPCFAGDTLVAVADGRGAISIKQLAQEKSDVPVYSMNEETGIIDIQWGRNPRLTREKADLVKINLDDGSSLRVTPDHKMILRDGTVVEARDLKNNDSLPRFDRNCRKLSKNNQNKYFFIRKSVDLQDKSITAEHRLIAKFSHSEKWNNLYDPNKKNGWVEGGIVVHHKNRNPLDNSPENLEIMTHSDHSKLHGREDNNGKDNPMWGKIQSEATRKLIGAKTIERCKDPEFRKKLSESHTLEERQRTSIRMSKQQTQLQHVKMVEREKNTDLKTTWIDKILHVILECKTCNKELIVRWGNRDKGYCDMVCANKDKDGLKARKKGQVKAFASKQKVKLDKQIDIYLTLRTKLGYEPTKKEWELSCKANKVSYRIRKAGTTNNPYVITSFNHLKDLAANFNHRVVSVEFLEEKEDVFNITVDSNHNLAIITDIDPVTQHSTGIVLSNCSEQTLFSKELCCLVETFPARHETLKEYKRTLKFAYLYAKTVTLVPTHNESTNAVMLRNRRIGTSQSGIAQSIAKLGIRGHMEWCDQGYQYLKNLDNKYSNWLCIPESIKISSTKPSGSVSLLPGATPGIHFPYGEYYWRTIRFDSKSPLLGPLREAGYRIVELDNEHNTSVVYFPIKEDNYLKGRQDITMWEQLELAAQMQYYWADNQVSVTITFKPEEAKDIVRALQYYETRLKSVSFLPLTEHGFKHAPYQMITKEIYNTAMEFIKPIKWNNSLETEGFKHKFCDSDSCEI